MVQALMPGPVPCEDGAKPQRGSGRVERERLGATPPKSGAIFHPIFCL